MSEQKKSFKEKEKKSGSSLLNRPSLTSRISSTSGEVKGISRKEFKPTIPPRRKKSTPASSVTHDLPKVESSNKFRDKLKDRLSGKPKTHDESKFKGRKEYVRATTGLFGGTDEPKDFEDPLASSRTAAELEEEKYIDPFHQSTNELTPVTLPINPRIDSKSKLLVGQDAAVTDSEKETRVSELLYRAAEDTTESTYLFNLPDLLPVDMSKLVDQEKDSDTEVTKPTLHNLPAGYLGRLQILKSGKARLMIGDIPFDVSLNSKSGFLQEILCCQTTSLDRGIIANIGTVPYSLTVSPDFDKLVT